MNETNKEELHKISAPITVSGIDIVADCHGRAIVRVKEPYSYDSAKKAFDDCNFVTLDKVDALSIIKIIQSVLDKQMSEGGSDCEINGIGTISFERLVDAYDGLIYR